MLSAGDFPLPCTSTSLLSRQANPTPSLRPLSLFPLSPPLQHLRRTHLELRAQRTDRPSRASPPKKKRSKTTTTNNNNRGPMFDMDELGLELGLDSFDDDDDEDYEDDDGSVLLPLERMTKWLENRPRGFGEGNVYDTSFEDQLLDEMRQSREAQAANIGELKSDPLTPDSNREEHKKKANELVPNGVRVRVTNLPKKKNVHRDLSAAFKGVPGLVSVNPVVSGNKKTRDPICKGFAFVYFKSEKDANRFVETFSRQSIAFGKIQKQIKCEMVDSKASESELLEQATTQSTYIVPKVEVEVVEEDQSDDYSDADDSFVGEFENTVFVEFGHSGDEVDASEWEDDEEDLESVTELELNKVGSFEQRIESESESESESPERAREPGKRLQVKGKGTKKRSKAAKGKEFKVPKLDILGSAKRLKVKEKAVLTDVFSKYGKKSALAAKKEG